MTNRKSIWLSAVAAIILVAGITTSCNKKFDEPPAYLDPSAIYQNTISIKDLKARHTTQGNVEVITGNGVNQTVIWGVVVCDDKSGNYYKQIAIQDSTGGILLSLDGTNLYTSYPVGRKLYVICDGLGLSDYNGTIQLGAVDNTGSTPVALRLPSTLFNTYIIKGTDSNFIAPKRVSISDLGTTMQDPYQSTLIQIDNAEIASKDTSKKYANYGGGPGGVNININTCSGQSIVAYTSNYTNFAGVNVPNGNGSIVGIAGYYKTTKQLTIRDTTDVKLYGPRCAGTNPTPTPTTFTSLSSLRSMYHGSDVTLPSSTFVTGVVISEATNISAGNIVIQDGTAGIDLYFPGTPAPPTANFKVGDSIIIDASKGVITSYKGLLELKLSASALPSSPVATGVIVVPKVLTAAQFLAQMAGTPAPIESSLVTIYNVNVPAVDSFYTTKNAGKVNLSDGTSFLLYTKSTANFNAPLPTVVASYTGYGSTFTTPQFSIRSLNDIR